MGCAFVVSYFKMHISFLLCQLTQRSINEITFKISLNAERDDSNIYVTDMYFKTIKKP